MSKKGVLLGLSIFLAILLISIISAADINDSEIGNFDKAYTCLSTQVGDALDADTIKTTETLAFSLMALGYDSNLQSQLVTKLEELKDDTDNPCWPKSACTIKDTALVMLAYNHIGKDNREIKNWLMNATISPNELVWYLEIDTENRSKCSIKYDGTTKTVNLDENKLITGSAGACLRTSTNGWLEVDNKCYGKEIQVSCDLDFSIATFYKSKSSSASPTYYITSSTQSKAQNDWATTKVESLCFKQGTTCNYEGTLWATLAVDKQDSSLKDKFLPYIITMASGNSKYLPSSFLYTLTDYNEYLNELSNLQARQGYWKASDTTRMYYDTAVALIKLGTSTSEQADLAKQYLLDPSIQTNEGCWNGNNVRDSAFLLYVLDPKTAKISTGAKTCSDYFSLGYACITSTACSRVNGTQQPYSCISLGTSCCSKSAGQEQTCSEKGGITCSSTQRCTGTEVSALGTTSCCIDGTCEFTGGSDDMSACELEGYKCAIQCDSTEETVNLACPVEGNGICCAPITTPTQTSSSKWWIWLLIILIILLGLAIFYRDQLKMWIFKINNKFSKSPSSTGSMPPRPMPPGGARPMMPFQPRRIVPGMMPPRPPMGGRPMMPPTGPGQFPKQNELDETMKKLKDMHK